MNWLIRIVGGASTLVVLRYEQIAGEGRVSAEELEWQFALLSSRGYSVPMSDVSRYLRGRGDLPRRGVSVTFDAADARTLHTASEALARHDLPATFFATVEELHDLVGNEASIRAKLGERFDVGSRTVSGLPLHGRPQAEICDELLSSRLRLEQTTARDCVVVAYPGPNDTEDAAVLTESGLAGYRLGMSRREGLNVVGALEPFAIRRVTIGPGMSRAAFDAALQSGRVAK